MGTYGTTFIIKEDKKIDFTDSYDGYFSCMGLNNLLSIKFMPDDVLNKLVDRFNDFDYKDYGEFDITERNIQEAIFEAEKDLGQNSPEHVWYKKQLEGEIRPSVTGFGPILYLGVNPSYNDSDDAQYIIDLDKKEFIYKYNENSVIFKLSFDEIRKTPENVLIYLGNNVEGCEFSLINNSNYKQLYSDFDELSSLDKLSKSDKIKLSHIQDEIKKEINSVLSLSPELVSKYEKEKEEEFQKYMNQHKQQHSEFLNQINDLDDSNENKGYSIHSINSVNLPTLRKVIFFIQKLIDQNPNASYLIDCTDWGINEDGKTGGFRFLRPKNKKYDQLHEEIIQIIQDQFKLKMNIMVSSGGFGFMDFDEDVKTEKSLYSLSEIINLSPEWIEDVKVSSPSLIYHVNYKEAREVALTNEVGHPNFTIPWVYVALINQDKKLFDKMYPQLQQISLTDEEKNFVYPSLLQSLTDGEQINKIMKIENNFEFVDTIRSLGFFDDMKDKMTNAELNKYFPHKSKGLKK